MKLDNMTLDNIAPYPWILVYNERKVSPILRIVDRNGHWVADLNRCNSGNREYMLRNAQLIASAPELLEECISLRNQVLELKFEKWYYEIENYSLRAERLTAPENELFAAFEAGSNIKDSNI